MAFNLNMIRSLHYDHPNLATCYHEMLVIVIKAIYQVDKNIFLCWGNNSGRLRNVRKVIGTVLPKYNTRAAILIMVDV